MATEVESPYSPSIMTTNSPPRENGASPPIEASKSPGIVHSMPLRPGVELQKEIRMATQDDKGPVLEAVRPPRPRRPNYNQIHSRPMPLNVYPLPFFAPHNPLSWVQIIYVIVKDRLYSRESHPETLYQGYFDETTRSVHVTDPATVRALWEQGFFGKGLLSRSEPTWLDMEMKRLGLTDSLTAEERTAGRRKERERFKRERARLERQMLDQLKQKEAGLTGDLARGAVVGRDGLREDSAFDSQVEPARGIEKDPSQHLYTPMGQPGIQGLLAPIANGATTGSQNEREPEAPDEPIELVNQEHLQLSREEAFYLSYALGSLSIIDPSTNTPFKDQTALLNLFRAHSYFPPAAPSKLRPDDQFLLSYVVYHHFRSLGWVVRDGVKFAVDYLLYQRGPAFTHAAFAIMIIPSYTHEYWFATPQRVSDVEKKRAKHSWHWLHCANRVQSQVVKTLVLVYVDVPPPLAFGEGDDLENEKVGLETLLRRYRVREFCIQRWSSNRNRSVEGLA